MSIAKEETLSELLNTNEEIVFVCPEPNCEPEPNLSNCERCFQKWLASHGRFE